MQTRPPIYHFLLSIPIQLIAFTLSIFIGAILNYEILIIVVHGAIAFFLARLLSFPIVWQLFNLLLWPIVYIILYFQVSNSLILVFLLVTIIIYVPTFWTKVPFYPTSNKSYEMVLRHLPEDVSFKFIDLGCGFGKLLFFLAKRRPNGIFVGVEIGPLPYLTAKLLSILAPNKNIKVFCQSFWNINLGEFDYAYAFLAPPPMPDLFKKAKAEMKSGSIFIVNSFPFQIQAESEEEVNDERLCILYKYVF